MTNVPVSLPESYHPYRSHITLGPSNRIWDNTSSCHSVKPAQSLICNTGESNYESVHHWMLSHQGSCNQTVQNPHRTCHAVGHQIIHAPLSGGHPPRAVQAVAWETGNRAAPNNQPSPIISQRGNFLPLWSFLYVCNYTNSERSLGVWDGPRD